MRESNRLDTIFGPVGSSAGVFLVIGGVLMLFFSWLGVIIIILGAFTGFSYTSTEIDFDNKRLRFSNNLFGLLKTGRWIVIEPDMKIGISKNRRGWRAYSRGGVPVDISEKDFRIVLYGSGRRQIIQIKKCNSLEKSRIEMDKLSGKLGLGLL